MGGFTRRAIEQRLPCPQRQVAWQIEWALHACGNDPAKFLKQRVCVQVTQRTARVLAVALKPGSKGGEGDFASGGYTQRFHKFTVAQKLGLLGRVFKAVRVIQRPRRLRQVA